MAHCGDPFFDSTHQMGRGEGSTPHQIGTTEGSTPLLGVSTKEEDINTYLLDVGVTGKVGESVTSRCKGQNPKSTQKKGGTLQIFLLHWHSDISCDPRHVKIPFYYLFPPSSLLSHDINNEFIADIK